MDILSELKQILTELLDIDGNSISPDTFLIQDLGAESIDLLELAVAVNSRFNIRVKDDEIFLTRFRQYHAEARQEGKDIVLFLLTRYPFLTRERIAEIITNIEKGPQLKVKDLVNYIAFYSKES